MEFFNQAIDILKILVMALGAGLAVWGVINLLEGYGSDNPAAKSQGIKQLMAGGGVVLIGLQLIGQQSLGFQGQPLILQVVVAHNGIVDIFIDAEC